MSCSIQKVICHQRPQSTFTTDTIIESKSFWESCLLCMTPFRIVGLFLRNEELLSVFGRPEDALENIDAFLKVIFVAVLAKDIPDSEHISSSPAPWHCSTILPAGALLNRLVPCLNNFSRFWTDWMSASMLSTSSIIFALFCSKLL